MTVSGIPDLPPLQPDWPAFQVWWQITKGKIESILGDQQSEIDTINAIIDPNTLTPDKKPVWMFMESYLTGEQSGLDSRATALSITTEKATYDNAISALTTYLATLTSPTAWNDTSGNTTIVDATFRGKFTDVLTAKQALLDKVDEVTSRTASIIDAVPDILVYADSTGTIKAGELPRNVNITASNGFGDVTTAGSWSVAATTGVTCTIGSATGVLNITALSVSEALVPVTFSYNGVSRTANVHLVVQADPPTNSNSGTGTGGTTATTTTLGNTTGSTYDAANAVSAVLQATAGSNGKVDLAAPISFKRNTIANNGQTSAIGKWQWWDGAAWSDIGGDTSSSSASQTIGGTATTGSITTTNSKTGLTNGVTYKFRYLWAENQISGIGADLYRVSGTLTATGS